MLTSFRQMRMSLCSWLQLHGEQLSGTVIQALAPCDTYQGRVVLEIASCLRLVDRMMKVLKMC